MNAQAPASARAPRLANPLAPYLALAALWLLTITIVPPRGNFPLNDDWMYGKVVQHLVETGEYQANPYADPTFILQAYWGAAFVKLFGFGFETLRISTLVLALIALWAAHWAAREAGLNKPWSLFVACLLLINPLFLNLSYTFMTDVPLLALTTVSGGCYLRAMRTQSLRWVWLGGAAAAAAFFVRQFGILLPMAFGAALAVRRATEKRRPSLAEVLALLVPLVAAFGLNKLLPTGGLSIAEGWDWNDLGSSVFARFITILRFLAISTLYGALFVAPLFIAGKRPNQDRSRKHALFFLPGIIVLALLVFPVWPHRLPLLGNLLYDAGVGPILMPGMLDGMQIAAPIRFGGRFWQLATAGCLALGSYLIVVLIGRPTRQTRYAFREHTAPIEPDLFLVLWAGAMILVLTLPPVHARFDRYLLTAQLPVCIVFARDVAGKRWMKPSIPSIVLAAFIYLFGLVCLQDYLAWNAAKWKALAELQTTHAAPLDQINGGYEFNGWVHSDHFIEESRRTHRKIFGPQGWWTLGDDYRVSLRQDRHFEVIGKEPYFSWLGLKERNILLLKRTEPDENSDLFH